MRTTTRPAPPTTTSAALSWPPRHEPLPLTTPLWAALLGLALTLGACSDPPRYSSNSPNDDPAPEANNDPSNNDPDNGPDTDPDTDPNAEPEGEPEPEGPLLCIDGSCDCQDGTSIACGGCFPQGEVPEDLCDCPVLCSEGPEPEPTPEPDPDIECVLCACTCANGQQVDYELCFEGVDPDPDACRSDNCAALCEDDPDPECPDNDGVCDVSCPMGFLRDDRGCLTCACDARLALAINGQQEEARNVSFEVEAGVFIGGINRWTFDLRWSFDDPRIADEAYEVRVPMRVQQDTGFVPGPDWVTFFIDNPGPWEAFGGRYTLFGFGVIEADLTITEGFLSIRQVGGIFELRTALTLQSEDPNGPGQIDASAAFRTMAP